MDAPEASGCSDFGTEVSRYAWGDVAEERRSIIEAHINECGPCRELVNFVRDLTEAVREDPLRSDALQEPCPDAALIVDLEAEKLPAALAKKVTAHLLYCKKCRDAYLLLRGLSEAKIEDQAFKEADAHELARRAREIANASSLDTAYSLGGSVKDRLTVVTGAGGVIGGALVSDLRRQGFTKIRAVDIKPVDEWHQVSDDAENLVLDLNLKDHCDAVSHGAYQIYNLAANLGGMGFIENNKALCMLSVLINTHMLDAARHQGVQKYFYSSSASVYNTDKQKDINNPGLKEEDAYPALAEDGYGWEKLFSERMCRHFREDFGLETRVARLHNVYGPVGPWSGGREKAPSAVCRKVIEAKISGRHEISIWGSGNQTRSIMYIDDCLQGIQLIMDSNILEPINLGSSEMVTINQLVDITEQIAGIKLKRSYDLSAPKGVNGRSSDNALIKKYLGWEPSTPLKDGLEKTYRWIYDEYMARQRGQIAQSKENVRESYLAWSVDTDTLKKN